MGSAVPTLPVSGPGVYAELSWGGGGSKQPKIPPGVDLGGGAKFLIYVWGGGGTWKPLWVHPCKTCRVGAEMMGKGIS